MIIKKGTLLVLTHGEYSDSSWNGPFTVLKNMDQVKVVEEYLAQFKKKHEYDDPDDERFTAFLTAKGYIQDVENSWAWHLGDYGFVPEIDGKLEERP